MAAFAVLSGPATGGSGTYSYSATGLPAGLAMSATGFVSGMPTATAASAAFTVTTMDTYGGSQTTTSGCSISVAPGACRQRSVRGVRGVPWGRRFGDLLCVAS